jgi:NAD(P)H-dependent FMN reductase
MLPYPPGRRARGLVGPGATTMGGVNTERAAGSRLLLVVHHTTSPSVQAMLESVLAGARTEEIVGVQVRVRPALAATAVDVLQADAFVLGTPANIGYMSGALKHFFDQIYYPCLSARIGAGYGVYVHGNSDTVGALRSVQTIVTGLGWQQVHQPVTVVGEPSGEDLQACWDLGATVAATLMSD